MSATATPPAAPPPPPVAAGRPPRTRAAARRAAAPLLSPPLARVVTLTALGGFAALRWGRLVDPSGGPRMLLLLLCALGAGATVAQLARLHPLLQAPAAGAVVLVWAALSALAAGVDGALVFAPGHWDDLAAGLQQGIDQLPRVLVPYGQPDQWPRVAILLGGALLLALGCVLGLAPGHRVPFRDGEPFGGGLGLRLAAAAPLVAAAVVPAAIMEPDAPALLGVVVFLLLAAFLWLERLPRAHVPVAVCLLLIAGAGGALATQPLASDEPWVDVQRLVDGLDSPDPARFDWSQSYGPIDWPRDGREVMRVSSPRAEYWKAQNLDGFDGIRWRTASPPSALRPDAEVPLAARGRRDWRADVRVTLRSFATSQVVGAGTTVGFAREPTTFAPGASPGTWTSDEPLEPGDGYIARTIVPRPSAAELSRAGNDYPAWAPRYLQIELPRRDRFAPGRWEPSGEIVVVPPFGSPRDATAVDAQARLAATPYRRAAVLAAALSAGRPGAYSYVEAVLAHLTEGYRYDERPPRRELPLDAFLFRDRAGYCQQFAGAAALLLRLGGVPARVAAGFTSGTRQSARGDFVVRDYDAHAWVEAWFPRIGWVRFDPTPTTAPARSGASPAPTPARGLTTPSLPRLPDAPPRDAGGPTAAPPADDRSPWPAVALLSGAAALLAGALWLARRLLRAPVGGEALLAELERALRRTGRPPAPATTLAQLEGRFHDAPDAAAYVRAIRLARFAGGEGVVTPRQRRALRGELARGLGLGGRLRALLALPPRLGR